MIEAFSGRDEACHPLLFAQLFRLRREVLAEGAAGSDLRIAGESGKDRFDMGDARHLLAIDEDDDIAGALRLLPTAGPHLLAGPYAHVPGAALAPRGEDVLEVSCLVVAPHAGDAATRDWLVGVLGCGLIEHCLGRGIAQVIGACDMSLLGLMLAMGWRVRPLGLPLQCEDRLRVATVADMTEEALLATRRSMKIERPVLSRMGFPVPRIPRHLLPPRGGPAARLH